MVERTQPDEATRTAEQAEGERTHTADRPATAEESAAADQELEELDRDEQRRVAEHFREMNEIGADVKGEGSVE
jgi:hypothetical protein